MNRVFLGKESSFEFHYKKTAFENIELIDFYSGLNFSTLTPSSLTMNDKKLL